MDTSIITRECWKKYDGIIAKWAEEFDVPASWVKAILLQESTLGENSRVQKGLPSEDGKSFGIAQLQPSTASWLAKRAVNAADLADDDLSIQLCTKYLSFLFSKFQGDEKKTIMSYNQGQGNTVKGKLDEPYYLSWCRWLELVEENS